MSGPDINILEFFDEKDLVLPPRAVYHNLVDWYEIEDVSYNHIKRRLRALLEHGLLEKWEGNDSYYKISEKGRAYLSGELERDEL